MKHPFVFALFGCLFAWVLPAQAEDQHIQIEVRYLEESEKALAAIEATRQKLDKPLKAVDLMNKSLDEALTILSEKSGAQFVVNWPALELVGIDSDSLVNYQAKELPVSQVLLHMLGQISADAFDDDKAGFACRAGVVNISTLRELKGTVVTRTYDIAPLIREPFRPMGMLFSEDAFQDSVAFHAWLRGEREYPFTDVMLLNLYKQHVEKMQHEIDRLDRNGVVPEDDEAKADAGGGGGDFGGLFADDDQAGGERIHESIDQLIELIAETVGDPDEWLDEESQLKINNQILIVKTTHDNHSQLKRMLDGLLQAEIDKQTKVLKDAHASQWVAQANQLLQAGKTRDAHRMIDQALHIMPDHVPANATKQVIEALLGDDEPVG
ncbi:MAG: hypothetical protein AAF085_14510 [Planctomycetota bacterium]